MKRILELRESSAHAGNATSRWRTVFIALVLALTIGGAGQTPLAQAAAADAVEIKFELKVYPEKLPRICPKKALTLYASVSKTVNKVIGGKPFELPGDAPGPLVSGSVVSGSGELKKQLVEIDTPGSAVPFVFTADKPGKVTLKFTASIKNSWIGANEEVIGSGVKVEKEVTVKVGCKVKVGTVSQFSAQGAKLVATMDGEMKSDEQGNFTGSATVNWVGGLTVGYRDCSGVIDVASSQADLTGNQDDSDRLAAEVTYLPAALTHTFDCGASQTIQTQVIPDPLVYSGPSFGGVSTQSQDLYEPTYYAMHGSAVIVVVPEEDEAVSLIPGGHQASWDDFPWIIGAFGLAITHAFKRKRRRVTHLNFKRWTILLLIFMLLLVSCQSGTDTPPADLQVTSTPPPDSQESDVLTIQADVVFGPGAFIFPDTEAGLADLSSYKSTLTLSFDGTRDGQIEQWSKTYVMLNTKEPAARQLTIEQTGDISGPDAVFIAEADGAAYERRGENACNATVIDQENSLIERLKPVGLLTGVVGADEAGAETVNDVAANHYTFDERAFGQLGLAKSTGEVWVASQGGYVAKYMLTTKGDADYFGEGIEGTLTWDYELTDVNQPVTFALPADCPAGMVDAPLLPDASNVLNMPSILAYDTSTSLADIAAFYQNELPNLDWTLVGEPTITETTALLDFMQGNQKMTVIVTADAGVTTVNILLEKAQE